MTKPKPIACPRCGSHHSKVIDARDVPRGRADQLAWAGEGFWRKRRCEACGRTFTTSETINADDESQPPRPLAADPPA